MGSKAVPQCVNADTFGNAGAPRCQANDPVELARTRMLPAVARKFELTWGGLCRVPISELREPRGDLTATQESADGMVCAGQRPDREGSSPSGARMRSAVSKGGGNASLAEARGRYGAA